MQRRRRIGAYGVCRDGAGRVLLVRASARSSRPATWLLPGGGVEHGEHPADAVVREVAEETGLRVAVVRARGVAAEVIARPPYLEHTDGVIYDLALVDGTLRPEVDGTSDAARWLSPDQVGSLPRSALVGHALGLPPPATEPAPPLPSPATEPVPPVAASGWPLGRTGQRFAAYGLVTDPAGRVLLTLISDGFPGAGRWHLPGGGTDFGEQPADGLRREVTEESGQSGQVGELLTVTHRHDTAALGPPGGGLAAGGAVARLGQRVLGRPRDWHAVRAVFRMRVTEPTEPTVLDVGGSTAEAGWFTLVEAARLPLTEVSEAHVAAAG